MSFYRKKAIIDFDSAKFAISSAGEKRTVHIVHNKTGQEWVTKTRTEWYGDWRKKKGGVLATINDTRPEDDKWSWDDFTYTDIQTPEPLSHVLHTAKIYTNNLLSIVDADSYDAYIGRGESWRVEASTLLKYKGTRQDVLRPVLMEDVVDYLIKKFGAVEVFGIENDDKIVMESYRKPHHFGAGVEKDMYSSQFHFLDMSKPELGIQNGQQFGDLWLDTKKSVKGIGRKHLMLQVCSQDATDNYAANCMSDKKFGTMGAYKALKDAKNDRELFQAAVDVYKDLYPEPKTVTGWRGDEIEIDWLYVMQENLTLAHMLRYEGDKINLRQVLDNLEVEYD